jgi:urea carboxylase
VAVEATVAGSLCEVRVAVGDRVAPGQGLAIVESMKIEIAVEAPPAGRVTQVLCQVGAEVTPGRRLVVLQAEPAAPAAG